MPAGLRDWSANIPPGIRPILAAEQADLKRSGEGAIAQRAVRQLAAKIGQIRGYCNRLLFRQANGLDLEAIQESLPAIQTFARSMPLRYSLAGRLSSRWKAARATFSLKRRPRVQYSTRRQEAMIRSNR